MRESLKLGLSGKTILALLSGSKLGFLHPENSDLEVELFCLNPLPYAGGKSHTIELQKGGPAPLGDEVVSPFDDPLHVR
jgi:hypothetical protein